MSLSIGDYALLADCNSAALVGRDGSLDWLCLPRYDSPSVFARILDADAGHWAIRPRRRWESRRRYLPGSLVLETTFETAEGKVRVLDALAFERGQRGHALGLAAPHEVLRLVEGLSGRVEVELELELRPEYGLGRPLIRLADGGAVTRGGPDRFAVAASVPLSIDDGILRGTVAVEAGESIGFALRWARAEEPAPEATRAGDVAGALEDVVEAWRSWEAAHDNYHGPHRELVRLSARVLKGLTYRPTGAVVAAPTTSLPEALGGERNWDYRYAWLRDASLTLYALLATGQRGEGHPFLDWICDRVCEDPEVERSGLWIMYDVAGGSDLEERELDYLEGYRGSRPVRIGNAAARQVQLDVYGEVLECFAMCCAWGREDIVRLWPHFRGLADWICAHWQERDNGIWEVRGGVRHFVYSKVMAWVALDRAIRTAERMGLDGNTARWRRNAEAIRDAVLQQGWSDRLGAFKQSLEDELLDASNLLLPLVGFLPPDDPRALANLERTRRELSHNGLLYRYLDAPEGVSGGEATFTICSFWLVNALAQAGRHEEAVALFERLLSHASPLGLLSEEIDGQTGELLGNFPQGFSHAGLLSAAVNLARAAGLGEAPESEGAPEETAHLVSSPG